MKKNIDLVANIETYKNLATFTTVEELNKTVREYRDVIRTSAKRADVRKNLFALLEILKRHSCKYVGVSFLCKNRIAEKMEVSYKTVQRLMKKLVDLHIVKEYAMKRNTTTNGLNQTANAVVIQPIQENKSDKKPIKRPKKCPTMKTTTKTLKQKSKDIHKRKEDVSQSIQHDSDFIDYRVPQSMRMKLQTAFDSKVINESFKNAKNITKKAAKQFNLLADTDIFHNILANASFVLFSKTQEYEHNGTLMKNPIGYFTRTFKQMVYNYIDSFRDIHNLAQRRARVHANNIAIFKRFIEG